MITVGCLILVAVLSSFSAKQSFGRSSVVQNQVRVNGAAEREPQQTNLQDSASAPLPKPGTRLRETRVAENLRTAQSHSQLPPCTSTRPQPAMVCLNSKAEWRALLKTGGTGLSADAQPPLVVVMVLPMDRANERVIDTVESLKRYKYDYIVMNGTLGRQFIAAGGEAIPELKGVVFGEMKSGAIGCMTSHVRGRC